MKVKILYILSILASLLAGNLTLLGQKRNAFQVRDESTNPKRNAYDAWESGGYNRFKNKYPFAEEDSTVTFFLRDYKSAKTVRLKGNFTAWSVDSLPPMTKTDSGWIIKVKLGPGVYWYGFEVDGVWKLDTDNLTMEHGGATVSVFYKSNITFNLNSFPNAKKVYLSGSFNDWREDELPMYKTKKGWRLSIYLRNGTYSYHFIVDGKKYTDIKNQNRVRDKFGEYHSVVKVTELLSEEYGYNRFKNNSTYAEKDSVVSFFLANNTDAALVYLTGSFVQWRRDAIPMVRSGNGWIASVKLDPGRYWYKFIVDGKWISDPDNYSLENSSGTSSSVFYKTNTRFRLPGFAHARKVYVSGSFNDWKSDELPMYKTRDGWELPMYLSEGSYSYCFIADNEKYADPVQRNTAKSGEGGLTSIIEVGLSKSVEYYKKALFIDEQKGDEKRIAGDFANIGYNYEKESDPANALKYFKKALAAYEKLNDPNGVADMELHIADCYHNSADLANEISYLLKATRAFDLLGRRAELAKTCQKIADYYMALLHYPGAVTSLEWAKDKYQQLGDQKAVAEMLGKLSDVYRIMPDPDKQLTCANDALKINEQLGNQPGIAFDFWLLADYHYRISSNISLATDYYKKSLRIFEQADDKTGMADVLSTLASIYLEAPDFVLEKLDIRPSEKYARAIAAQQKSLEIFTVTRQGIKQISALLSLSKSYEKIKVYDSAYLYFQKYINMRDMYFNLQSERGIAFSELRYHTQLIEDSLRNQQAFTNDRLQKQLMLARQQQQQLALNQSQLALTNKERDLQHLAYLKTQADLSNAELIKQQKEKENELQATQVKSLTQKNEIIELNQQRQWIYIIGGFVLLALGSLYFIYRSRLQAVRLESQLIKEKAAQERKEMEFQQKLADISMSALRSQMNPHFIFNCLNSIKLYTTQNDTAAASAYLTKFSRLIRLVLDNSRNERITLSSELAALELYVQMEAMRFKEKLSYSFHVAEDVESDYIEIPPLLLQPYVENAIWHGLMPREKGGNIAINVALREDQSLLEIKITDNGIGRAASAALRSKMSDKHRSYGMKATTERIALINQIYKTGANVFVRDLADANGEAAGTEVNLQIPI